MELVSRGGEELLSLLVAWEMLDRGDLDPHRILRDVSDTDLEVVRTNLLLAPETKQFVSCELVELELMYRRGLLEDDWSLERDGDDVKLSFVVTHPGHWNPHAERILA